MNLNGVGAWVWNDSDGAPGAVVRRAIAVGLDYLLVRAWNGQTAFDRRGFDFSRQYRAYVSAAGDRIRIVPWTYVYGPAAGNAPGREAESFWESVKDQHPDLLVVDIEHEGQSGQYGGRGGATAELFTRLQTLTSVPVGYSTYDLPAIHDVSARDDGMAYGVMDELTSLALPQVYWKDRTTRGAGAVRRMLEQWHSWGLKGPVAIAVEGMESVTRQELHEAWAEVSEPDSHVLTPSLSLYRWGELNDETFRFLDDIADRDRPPATDWRGTYFREHDKWRDTATDLGDAIHIINNAWVWRPRGRRRRKRLNAKWAGRIG